MSALTRINYRSSSSLIHYRVLIEQISQLSTGMINNKQYQNSNHQQPTTSANPAIVRAAMSPIVPSTIEGLAKMLIANVIHQERGYKHILSIHLHILGDFVIINKPYNVSCYGPNQMKCVFPSSRFDERFIDSNDDRKSRKSTTTTTNASFDGQATIEDTIPYLADAFREPNLHLFTGLKRYLTGPIVLPASRRADKKIKHVLRTSTSAHFDNTDQCIHQVLAICVGKPNQRQGIISGLVQFQSQSGDRPPEYMFRVDSVATSRQIGGRYAINGAMRYEVLASAYGCSLIDLKLNKFARHLPRLMLTELTCPVLGDQLYQSRIMRIANRSILISSSSSKNNNQERYLPYELIRHLGITIDDYYRQFPFQMHIYRTTLRHYAGNNVHLIASAHPPKHFVAMCQCLGFTSVLHKHFELNDMTTDID